MTGNPLTDERATPSATGVARSSEDGEPERLPPVIKLIGKRRGSIVLVGRRERPAIVKARRE